MMIADHEQQKTTKPCLLCVLKFIVKGPDTSQTELGAKGQKRARKCVSRIRNSNQLRSLHGKRLTMSTLVFSTLPWPKKNIPDRKSVV